jgi:hypothetical protein
MHAALAAAQDPTVKLAKHYCRRCGNLPNHNNTGRCRKGHITPHDMTCNCVRCKKYWNRGRTA